MAGGPSLFCTSPMPVNWDDCAIEEKLLQVNIVGDTFQQRFTPLFCPNGSTVHTHRCQRQETGRTKAIPPVQSTTQFQETIGYPDGLAEEP